MRIPAILLALVAILGLRPAVPKPAQPDPETVWHMTLPEAIRIGLNNKEVVRCINLGGLDIPLGGFEPSPTLGTIHDESIPAGDPAPDRE